MLGLNSMPNVIRGQSDIIMSIRRNSAIENESGQSRRFTIRLPWDVAKWIMARERKDWTVTQEIESCVRLKMNATKDG